MHNASSYESKLVSCVSECTKTFQKLRKIRTTFLKAMHVQYVGRNFWGVGHVLPAAFLVHQYCFSVQRNCYVSIYDSDVNKYFRYHSGHSWNIEDYDYSKNASSALIKIQTFKQLTNLEIPDSDLVTIQIRGLIPFNSNIFLPALPWDRKIHDRKLDLNTRCFFRFVMWPILEKATLHESISNRTIHVRTGFADGPTVVGRIDQPWFDKLCNWSLFAKHNVISDSPRIARKNGDKLPAGKTDFKMTDSVFRDTVVAMLSWSIVTVKPSSFIRPLAVMSCIHEIQDIHRICPKFRSVFPRDMIGNAKIANDRFKNKNYWPPHDHPCYGLSGKTCAAILMQALI